VVALSGDDVLLRGGRAIVNGRRERTRSILVSESTGSPAAADTESQVPPDHVFILADNRASVGDSRQFGAVPTANIVGRPAWWLMRHDDAGKIDWSAVGELVGP
jgi:signal peptidase I